MIAMVVSKSSEDELDELGYAGLSQNNTCAVPLDDSSSNSSICFLPCCSLSLSSLDSLNNQTTVLKQKPAELTTTMQTRSLAKKENGEDDNDSIIWGTEDIFDPPQRNSKSCQLDSKLAAKPPVANKPLFSPLGLDDSEEKQAEEDSISFKPSLSKYMDDDSSFSDYLGTSQHSLKGSPAMSRTPSTQEFSLGHLPFPSPVNDMPQMMNDALGMSFDFNENTAEIDTMASSPLGGHMGFNFPRLKPGKSGPFSLNTPPRNAVPNSDHSPETKKGSLYAHGTQGHQISDNRAICKVASKSPMSSSKSHATPERSLQGKMNFVADNSPAFIPPRTNLRTESRTPNFPTNSTSLQKRTNHQKNVRPIKNGSSDFCVTPSPSHSLSRISKAVSDESNTPPRMPQCPPIIYPSSYCSHNSAYATPSSIGHGSSNETGIPHPPSYPSPNWSNSLHMAPLPPFLAPNGSSPTPQWQHPSGIPGQVNASAPYGYPQFSTYYSSQQITPPKCQKPWSVQESSAEATHWRQKHHLLYQFRAKFGHCRVPPGYGVGTEYEGLFEWVMDQIYQHKRLMEGEVSTMTPTRARVLSDIGLVFNQESHELSKVASGTSQSPTRKVPSSWPHWISQLADYKRKHGNCDVPLKYPENPSLGTFVNRQRTEYRKMLANKPNSMTNKKVDELNKLGFTWAVRESHTSWQERFEELKAFKEKNGHANVPKVYPTNPSLGYWVNEQRFQYRRHKKKKCSYMTEDKIKAMNSLDFKWSLREINGSWDNWLKQLKSYKDQYGDVDVPLKYKPNLALGAFVNRQRTEYRKLKQGLQSSLTANRIKDLNSMGFKWSIRVSRTPWEQRLNELKNFKAEYGHTNVPSTYPPNQPLAYWIFKQRGQYRIYLKNCMSRLPEDEKPVCHMTADRIRMLNDLGFEWNPPRRVR